MRKKVLQIIALRFLTASVLVFGFLTPVPGGAQPGLHLQDCSSSSSSTSCSTG